MEAQQKAPAPVCLFKTFQMLCLLNNVTFALCILQREVWGRTLGEPCSLNYFTCVTKEKIRRMFAHEGISGYEDAIHGTRGTHRRTNMDPGSRVTFKIPVLRRAQKACVTHKKTFISSSRPIGGVNPNKRLMSVFLPGLLRKALCMRTTAPLGSATDVGTAGAQRAFEGPSSRHDPCDPEHIHLCD